MLTEFCRYIVADYFNFLSFLPETTMHKKNTNSIKAEAFSRDQLTHSTILPSNVSKTVEVFLVDPVVF